MTILPNEYLVHERTLLGAVDSYLKRLVRVRPQVAGAQKAYLEALADSALEQGLPNNVEVLTTEWLESYLASVDDRAGVEATVRDFCRWLSYEGLIAEPPLG